MRSTEGGRFAKVTLRYDHVAIREIAEREANTLVAGSQAAAVSIAVAQAGKLIFAEGYGLADVTSKREATPETIYRIGSLTKQITTIAILHMARRGIASFNDPLGLHLSDAPRWARAVTLRQLATHIGGAPDNLSGLRALASRQRRPDDEEQVAALMPRVCLSARQASNGATATLAICYSAG